MSSTAYVPTPGETVVVYGDSKQTTKWNTIEYGFDQVHDDIETHIPFILKKNAKLKIEFTVNAKAHSGPYEEFWVSLTDANYHPVIEGIPVATSVFEIKPYDISLTTTNAIPAGTYYITFSSDRWNTIYYQSTSGTLTNNNYIEIPANSSRPSAISAAQALAKYTIITE